MPRILVTAGFKFAVDGLHVIEVAPGEQDVSERCAEVAVDQLKVASRLDGAAIAVEASAPVVAVVVSPAAETPPVVPPAAVKPASPPKAPAKPKAAPKAKPAVKAKPNAGGAA